MRSDLEGKMENRGVSDNRVGWKIFLFAVLGVYSVVKGGGTWVKKHFQSTFILKEERQKKFSMDANELRFSFITLTFILYQYKCKEVLIPNSCNWAKHTLKINKKCRYLGEATSKIFTLVGGTLIIMSGWPCRLRVRYTNKMSHISMQ